MRSLLGPLDEAAMIEILTKPRNAIVRQYQKLFELGEARLEFTDGALREIVAKAIKRDVGARALRAIVEEVMLNIMYELPDQKEKGGEYTITKEMVTDEAARSASPARKRKKESA